jgi:hypothetical protein
VTHHGGVRRVTPSRYEVLVDGERIAERAVELAESPAFVDLEVPLPAERTAGRERVTLRLAARDGSQVATVFALRLVRADALRAGR